MISRSLAAARRSIAKYFERQAAWTRLAELDRRGSLDAVLRDLGMTLPEMERIVRNGAEARRLLPAMAERLGVAVDKLDPRTRYALGQTCAACVSHRRCRRWLARSGANSAVPKEFCPNAELFEASAGSAGLA